ncbi:chorismate-binding protein [Flexithrix dorotheae]|uniref:chorismate-binding protein n=1 Tax=Flexithrix dorotheae TaxID=70993 RepID=UPI0003673691|nr:chorismate-binding protein [Flexithrix dorotheae]
METILNQFTGLCEKESILLKGMLTAVSSNNLPVVFWRLPNETDKHAIVDFSGELKVASHDLEEMPGGFIISPFNNNEDTNYFIRADLYYNSSSFELKESLFGQEFGSTEEKNKEKFTKALKETLKRNHDFLPEYHLAEVNDLPHTKEHFIEITEKSIAAIREHEMQKVVLSRTKKVAIPENFDPVDYFNILCENYPKAFISLISVPGLGTWIGATPEILIKVDEKKIFTTISLAGTQPKDKFENLSEASWTQKEIEEQALVSRYIINCFKKIRLREFEELGPKTVAAGSLLHLRTDFTVDTIATNFPQLGSVMLKLLHPTSAVCGMPKEKSLAYILENEGYDRSLYSGYFGPVNIQRKTNIFVNLRCLQILNDAILLYAGAGITEDSVPDKEWRETEMKMDILLNFLKTGKPND